MAISIEILEIDNGFTVSLFDSEGTIEHDKNVYVETMAKVFDLIKEWLKKEA